MAEISFFVDDQGILKARGLNEKKQKAVDEIIGNYNFTPTVNRIVDAEKKYFEKLNGEMNDFHNNFENENKSTKTLYKTYEKNPIVSNSAVGMCQPIEVTLEALEYAKNELRIVIDNTKRVNDFFEKIEESKTDIQKSHSELLNLISYNSSREEIIKLSKKYFLDTLEINETDIEPVSQTESKEGKINSLGDVEKQKVSKKEKKYFTDKIDGGRFQYIREKLKEYHDDTESKENKIFWTAFAVPTLFLILLLGIIGGVADIAAFYGYIPVGIAIIATLITYKNIKCKFGLGVWISGIDVLTEKTLLNFIKSERDEYVEVEIKLIEEKQSDISSALKSLVNNCLSLIKFLPDEYKNESDVNNICFILNQKYADSLSTALAIYEINLLRSETKSFMEDTNKSIEVLKSSIVTVEGLAQSAYATASTAVNIASTAYAAASSAQLTASRAARTANEAQYTASSAELVSQSAKSAANNANKALEDLEFHLKK